MTNDDIDNVLEMYYNETQDYNEIADRCNLTTMDVANIVNDFIRETNLL